ERLALDHQLERTSGSERAGHPLGAACTGDEPERDLRQADAVVAERHDPEIAGKRELASSSEGDSVDGCDEDLVESVHPEEELVYSAQSQHSRDRGAFQHGSKARNALDGA